MTELRWLLTREQKSGAFSEPIPWPDGTTVYARMQYREKTMVEGAWLEIPVVSEVKDQTRVLRLASDTKFPTEH